jgi:hypothetical protein
MKKLILFVLVGLWTGVANAQSPWLSDSRLTSISIEWDKPLLDDNIIDQSEVAGLSSSLFLTGRVRVTDNFRLEAELPVSHFGFENSNPVPGGNDYSTEIGNVYVGGIYDVQSIDDDNHLFFELGVRIPTSRQPNDIERFGRITGMSSEATDRLEAFLWDTWSVPLSANYITPVSGPFFAKFRLGTIYNMYVDDLESLDNEFHLLYGISALYRESNFEATLGFNGRNPYAGNNPDFIDDGFTQIRAGVARPFGNIVPGVYVRKPLGENYNQLVDFAYGFYIEVRR